MSYWPLALATSRLILDCLKRWIATGRRNLLESFWNDWKYHMAAEENNQNSNFVKYIHKCDANISILLLVLRNPPYPGMSFSLHISAGFCCTWNWWPAYVAECCNAIKNDQPSRKMQLWVPSVWESPWTRQTLFSYKVEMWEKWDSRLK